MGVGERILSVVYKGDVKSLVGASKEAEGAVGGFGSKFAGVAKVAAASAVAIGAAAVGFAAKSADTFSRVGSEVLKLQRYTGLTAESASRLRFAAQETGINVDSLSKSLGILSKNSTGNGLDKLSLGLKDAHGKALPLNDQLLKLAQKFQSMPAGAEKNALALKVFGKAGIDMLPFLNKGAAGIAELEKQSDKLGNTLSQKGLDAVKASTAAHREFHAVMEGLQLQVGQYVLPVITKFVTLLSELLLPAIKVVGDIAQNYLAPAISWAFGVIGQVMGDVSTFATGTLWPAVGPVLKGLADIAHDYLAPLFSTAFGVAKTVMGDVVDFATGTLVPLAIPALRSIADFVKDDLAPGFVWAFGIVKQVISDFVDFAKGTLVPGVQSAINKAEAALAPFAAKAEAAFERVRKAVEEKLTPAMRDKLDPAVTKVKTALGTHLPAAMALGGAGTIVLATQLGNLVGALGAVVTAVAIIPNPVLLVIAAIAALAAGLVYAYTHSAEFRDIVDQVGSTLRDGLGAAITAVQNAWPGFVDGIKTAVDVFKTDFLPTIQAVGDWLSTNILPILAAFVGTLIDTFSQAVAWVKENWPAISEAVTHVMNVIRDVITIVTNIIAALWRAWGDDLLHIVGGVFDAIGSTIQNAFTIIEGIFTVVLALINGDWSGAWDGIKQIASGVWDEIRNQISFAINTVKSIIGGVLSTIAQVWAGAWSGVQDKLSSAWTAIKSIVSTGVGAVLGFFTGIGGKISGLFSGVADAISKPFTAAFAEVKKLWNSTIGGFGFSLPSWIPFVGGKSFHIPKMHLGGIVPGGFGSEPVYQLRGGEGVFTPEQMRALGIGLRSGWGDHREPPSRMMVTPQVQIYADFRGAVGIDGPAVERWMISTINQAITKGLFLKT